MAIPDHSSYGSIQHSLAGVPLWLHPEGKSQWSPHPPSLAIIIKKKKRIVKELVYLGKGALHIDFDPI